MASGRRTKHPPARAADAGPATVAAAETLVRDMMQREHLLAVPLRFLLVVEGTTDKAYLECAAQRLLEASGFDLLQLESGLGSNSDRMCICTPINPEDPERKRGGLPRVEKLADHLRPYALLYEIVGPICFSLDHDLEGQRVEGILKDFGYVVDRAKVITLDPKSHPGACRFAKKGNDPIVIEDLLALRIQLEHFRSVPSYCEVVYEAGSAARIGWRNESKASLCEFVCQHAKWQDLVEIARLLIRVRQLWRLEVPDAIVGMVSAPL